MSLERHHMRGNTVIRASAGTGKTHALVETTVHLLAGLTHLGGPVKPRELVCITFTEKAAGEMLERIRRRVDDLAEGHDDELARSADSLPPPKSLPDRRFWSDVRREIDQLRVNTFHSFCLALLQRYPLEAGLDPTFGVYDQEGLSGRLEDLAELTVLGALEEEALRPSVEALLERIDLRRRYEFSNGLADLLPALMRSIHEAGLEIPELERLPSPGEGELAARERELASALTVLLDRLDQRFTREKRRLGQVDFADMQRLARNLLRARPDIRHELKGHIKVLLVDEFQDTNPVQRDIVLMLCEPVDFEADWTAREPAAIVPPDFVLGPRRLFVVGDPKQSIYDFRGADVSTFSTTEQLIARSGGVVDALRVSFRARPTLVQACNEVFEEALRRQDGEEWPWFVHWSPDAALDANRGEEIETPAVHLIDSETFCRERALEAGRVKRLDQAVEFDAVAELIRDVVEGSRGWSVVGESGVRGVRYGDITVLLRRFVRTLSPFTQALDRRQIPYYVVKGSGFFAAREVADLSIALRAICASADAPAVVAWLRGPMIGLSDLALARLARRHGRIGRFVLGRIARGEEPLELFSANDQRALTLAASLLRELGRHGEAVGPARALDVLLARTDWMSVNASLPQGDQAIANVERVRRLAEQYRSRTGGGLAGFARVLSQLVQREPPQEPAQVVEEGQDVVRVMTIHQAKGLQCRIAVIPDADPGRPPHPPPLLFSPRLGIGVRLVEGEKTAPGFAACRAELESRRLAELRRLMYVAFTRARDHVVVSGNTPRRKDDVGVNGSAAVPISPRGPDWMHVMQFFKARGATWLDVISLESLLHQESPPSPPPTPPPPPSELEALQQRLDSAPSVLGGRLVTAVTQLGDYAICSRRYWYLWEAGLLPDLPQPLVETPEDEILPAFERGDGQIVWPVDPIDRGTLAHAILELVDAETYLDLPVARRRPYLESLAETLGSAVPSPDRDEVLERVARLLNGEVGRLLAGEPALEREDAFMLHVPVAGAGVETGLFLRGQIDLVVPGDLLRPTLVLDYKYSPPRRDLSFYAFQLRCYALAHYRRTGAHPESAYRAGIVFLRTAEPAPAYLSEPLTAPTLERFAQDLSELGGRLLHSRQICHWPRLDPREYDGVCRTTHCRFRHVCFVDP